MTVELITGYSGAPHIDSSDVQHLIAGVVGPGSYVLQTQNKLSLAVNSANKVTLNTGDAVIAGGAHVRVSAAEALTVTSGTQGANRNDLVVLRYTKNSSNVESAQAVVIKGTATSGIASDPAYNTGSIIDGKTTVDMPLYRLPISGVNLGTPVKLFSEQPSMMALGDSVSKFAVPIEFELIPSADKKSVSGVYIAGFAIMHLYFKWANTWTIDAWQNMDIAKALNVEFIGESFCVAASNTGDGNGAHRLFYAGNDQVALLHTIRWEEPAGVWNIGTLVAPAKLKNH